MFTRASSSAREASRGNERPIEVRVRRMRFDFPDDTPELWFDGDPFLTLFYTAFSATLPEGERMFIRAVRNYLDRIDDPVLRAEVQAFVGQEAQHAQGHEAFNRFMERKGYSIARIEEGTRAFARWVQKQPPAVQLALTVSAEHFTALMADYHMRKVPELADHIDPSVLRLWAWHVIEEAEHKAVAFDVYQHAVGDKALLNRVMAIQTVMFVVMSGLNAFTLLEESGHLRDWAMWRRTARRMLSPTGFLPLMWRDYLDFYRRDFHPWQHDNREALKRWRAQYLGEEPPEATA